MLGLTSAPGTTDGGAGISATAGATLTMKALAVPAPIGTAATSAAAAHQRRRCCTRRGFPIHSLEPVCLSIVGLLDLDRLPRLAARAAPAIKEDRPCGGSCRVYLSL